MCLVSLKTNYNIIFLMHCIFQQAVTVLHHFTYSYVLTHAMASLGFKLHKFQMPVPDHGC